MVDGTERKFAKTFLLIDGHALAFRSYFALERTGMKTSDKQPTWAVYGFFKAIFDILKNPKIHPDAIAVAFDVGRQTFRLDKYPEYKANRESMPDDLHSQLGLIIEGLNAFSIPIYTKEGFEADDVIGTISKKASKLNHRTLILTGDQDSFQLIDEEGCVRVLIPSKGDLIEYDCEKVHEKLGVYPNQVIDYKALRGDTSDNIPGIKGIGEKTAAKLLGEYGNLENIYANIENIKEKALKQKLIDGEEIAKLSQYLATIDCNVDIDFDVEKTNLVIEDFSKVSEFLRKVQFYSFLKNIENVLSPFVGCTIFPQSEAPVEKKDNAAETVETTQLGFFNVNSVKNQKQVEYSKEIVNTEEKLSSLVKKLSQKTVVALEVEVNTPEFWQADICGVSFAVNEGIKLSDDGRRISSSCQLTGVSESFYVPVNEKTLKELEPVFSSDKIAKIMHDAKYQINCLRKYGISLNNVIFDTMLARYISDPSQNLELNLQSFEVLDFVIKDRESLLGKGKMQKDICTLPEEAVGEFAQANTAATLALADYWSKNLNEKEQKLLYDIEVPLSYTLASMEWAGVSIDRDYLSEIANAIDADLSVCEKQIYAIAGEEFNINSPKKVGEILFEKLNLKTGGKTKTKAGYSTSAKVLEQLAEDNEIAGKILEHRHLSKLKSTYVDTLPELVVPYDNRIHTTFNQAATLTGRLSSSNPNLQNIPIRTQLGNKIRGAFVPADKTKSLIMSADYSQIELRLLAHISQDKNMIDAINSNVDIHTLTASKVFGVSVENVTKEMRSKAKTVNFGIVYGQTRYGLAKSLNISPNEAQSFIDKYFEGYPNILMYMQTVKAFVQKNGYVETIYGRRRYLEDQLMSSNFQIREFAQRAAINQPLQGTAADLIKIAMNNLYKKLNEGKYKSKMILQVHDELILEVDVNEVNEVETLVRKEMELGQPLRVPLVVDVHTSNSWMEN